MSESHFLEKSLKTTPKWGRSFHALTPFFRPFFLLGAQMGSQGPSRVPRKWFSGGLAIDFCNFFMHLSTRLQRKSTVAEQRGCALDKNMLACVKLREKKKHVQKCPERVKNYFIFFNVSHVQHALRVLPTEIRLTVSCRRGYMNVPPRRSKVEIRNNP